MDPTNKAIDAAYATLPYSDLLYGDTTKALSMAELTTALKAAYKVDFPEREENENSTNRRS